MDEYREVKLEAPEDGWRFAGYSDCVVQDIKVERSNVCYRREVWISPDGRRHVAVLPAGVQGHDFVVGAEVLNVNEGHARVRWKVFQQLRHGFQAPCRGTNSDNGKVALGCGEGL